MATPTNTTGLQEEENLVEDTTQITEAQAQAMADEKNLTGQERQSYIESLFGINASATEQADTGTQESDEDTAIERPIIDGTETTTADSTTGDGTTGATVTQADIDALQPPSLEEIRQQQIDRAQSLIDATESLFAADIANLQEQGEEALAQTSSIFTSANLAGTPFKLTAETQTQEATQEAVEARRAERAAEIASIMAQAEGRADDLYQQQIENFRAEREFLVSERDKANAEAAARAEAAKTAALGTIDTLAQGGYSLEEMDSDTYQKLLSNAGITDFEAKARWAANTPEANAQYSIQNGQLVGVYFDPTTQKPVVSTTPAPPELLADPGADIQTITDAQGNVYWYDANNPMNPDGTLNTYQVGEGAVGDGEELLSVAEAEKLGVPYGTTRAEAAEMEVTPGEDAASLEVNEKYLEGLKTRMEEIKDLMNHPGLSIATGTSALGRYDTFATRGIISEFMAKAKQLISQETLNQLATAKERGITFGALSEEEMRTVSKAATALGDWLVEKDNGKSYFNTSDANVMRELNRLGNTIENAYQDGISELQSADVGTANFSTLDDFVEQNPAQLPLVEEVLRSYPNATDEEILEIINESFGGGGASSGSQPFSSDLNTSVNGSGASNILSLGKITGYGSPYWKEGLDIDLQIGDPVPSVGGGQVIFAGRNGGFGNQVKVRTPNGNEIWYSHLDSINVGVGDTVSDGQVVGAGGNTGSVIPGKGGDGSHLDLTVQKPDGSFYDPREIEQLLKQYA